MPRRFAAAATTALSTAVCVSLVALTVVATAQQLSDCDPLDPTICALPFPNNFWLRPDASQGGALRLAFGPKTFPTDLSGRATDPVAGGWNALDGFSALAPISTYLGNVSLARSNVPPYWDLAQSLAAGCPTALLDATTGELVAHFGELDHTYDDVIKTNVTGAYQRLFMMWPSQALQNGHRYIVAMRGLVDEATGAPIASSAAFAALRDGTPTNDPDVELRRALFKDIFARLSAVGFQQSTLQLAWDFTVGSKESITGRLTFMRDDALSRVAPNGPAFTIVSVANNISSDTARRIEVQLMAPQYVDSPLPGATLVLDADGVPVYQGLAPVNVTVWVPMSLAYPPADGSGPSASVLQYGHGLFGSRSEAGDGYLQSEANRYGYVIIASDWIGLSEYDEVTVGLMFAENLTDFRMVPDRSSQGMVHALLLMRLLKSPAFLTSSAMRFGTDQHTVLTPSAPSYYNGNSQGGILGSVYMAVSTDVTRGTLGVFGGPYSMLCPRSVDYWTSLGEIVRLKFAGDPIAQIHTMAIVQLLWDRAEPGGYMNWVRGGLPNTPNHDVLLHNALGDAQVSYVGAYMLARSVGARIFESNVDEPNEQNFFGLPSIPDGALGRGAHLVTWQFDGVPPVPQWNVPPSEKTDTHDGPRNQLDGQEMMFVFFSTGDVVNTCGGPCVSAHIKAENDDA